MTNSNTTITSPNVPDGGHIFNWTVEDILQQAAEHRSTTQQEKKESNDIQQHIQEMEPRDRYVLSLMVDRRAEPYGPCIAEIVHDISMEVRNDLLPIAQGQMEQTPMTERETRDTNMRRLRRNLLDFRLEDQLTEEPQLRETLLSLTQAQQEQADRIIQEALAEHRKSIEMIRHMTTDRVMEKLRTLTE